MPTSRRQTGSLVIEKNTLVSQAKVALRREIVAGRLRLGQRLREVPLAARLGLSRGTLRAALSELEREGLIERRPYAGWSVVALTPADAHELYTLRQALEGLAARLAAQAVRTRSTHALDEALKVLERVCRDGERSAVVEADLALHLQVIEMAGHGRLKTLYEGLADQIRVFIAASDADIDDESAIYEEHRRLVAAILSGNGDLAEIVAHEHNAAAGEALYRRISALMSS